MSLYPKDGGFLYKHFDGYSKADINALIHFKVELTHKDLDYKKGGFYIWDNNGKEIDLSSQLNPTDVLFFNGANPHEVKPIKGGKGRIALFEIPTHVTEESMISNYSGEGDSKISKIRSKIKYYLNKGISKL